MHDEVVEAGMQAATLQCHAKLDLADGQNTCMQAQAALSGQLVVARQQHADVCLQLQRDHAALQQAALQEHALQKVTLQCYHTADSSATLPHMGGSLVNILLPVPCSTGSLCVLPRCKSRSMCPCYCRSPVQLLLVSIWLACTQQSLM